MALIELQRQSIADPEPHGSRFHSDLGPFAVVKPTGGCHHGGILEFQGVDAASEACVNRESPQSC
jgi:hypothetical protein